MDSASPLYVVHQIRSGSRTPNILPPHPQGLDLQRVWTLIDEDLLNSDGPVHNRSAFLEDRIHDWRFDRHGQFYYFSRVVPIDTDVKIVLDYETMKQRNERLSQYRPQFDPQTGRPVGNP